MRTALVVIIMTWLVLEGVAIGMALTGHPWLGLLVEAGALAVPAGLWLAARSSRSR